MKTASNPATSAESAWSLIPSQVGAGFCGEFALPCVSTAIPILIINLLACYSNRSKMAGYPNVSGKRPATLHDSTISLQPIFYTQRAAYPPPKAGRLHAGLGEQKLLLFTYLHLTIQNIHDGYSKVN